MILPVLRHRCERQKSHSVGGIEESTKTAVVLAKTAILLAKTAVLLAKTAVLLAKKAVF